MGNNKGFENICKLNYHFVYQTKNLINGKTYIGRHSTNNLDDGYIGSGTLLKRAIKKHGKENFLCTHMCYFDSYVESVEEEKFLVTKDYCKKEGNYNIVEGGSNPIMYGSTNPKWKGGIPKYDLCKCGTEKRKTSANCKLCDRHVIKNIWLTYDVPSTEKAERFIKTKLARGLTTKVKVENVIYNSVLECGRKYNINETAVRHRCASPHFINWAFNDSDKQEIAVIKYYEKIEKRKLKNSKKNK